MFEFGFGCLLPLAACFVLLLQLVLGFGLDVVCLLILRGCFVVNWWFCGFGERFLFTLLMGISWLLIQFGVGFLCDFCFAVLFARLFWPLLFALDLLLFVDLGACGLWLICCLFWHCLLVY